MNTASTPDRTCRTCGETKPLVSQNWHTTHGKFDIHCAVCRRAKNTASRRRNNGHMPSAVSGLAEEFPRDSRWNCVDEDGRKFVFVVSNISEYAGLRVQGWTGKKVQYRSVTWLRAHGQRA